MLAAESALSPLVTQTQPEGTINNDERVPARRRSPAVHLNSDRARAAGNAGWTTLRVSEPCCLHGVMIFTV